MTGATKPVALGRSAKAGAPAPWQAAEGGPHTHQRQLPRALMKKSSLGETALTPICTAGPSIMASVSMPAERQPHSPQQSLVRRQQGPGPVLFLLEQFRT